MKCFNCRVDLPEVELKHINGNYGYCAICTERSNQYTSKKRLREKSTIRSLQGMITAYKMEKGCSICGYNKCGEALHLHHLDPKDKTSSISRMAKQQYSIDRIQLEMDKCVVMCANCHAEQHYVERAAAYLG